MWGAAGVLRHAAYVRRAESKVYLGYEQQLALSVCCRNRRSAITTNAGSNLKTRQKISQGLRREYHTSNLSLVRIMGLAT